MVIRSAGRNNLTHVFEISREDESFSKFQREAIDPVKIVNKTAKEASIAPTKLGRMPLDIVNLKVLVLKD